MFMATLSEKPPVFQSSSPSVCISLLPFKILIYFNPSEQRPCEHDPPKLAL